MSYVATKVVIITEKLIQEQVTALIEELGGHGYTIVAAGGKGSRGVRRASRARVVDEFSNVKIETITTDSKVASKIADEVAHRFLDSYSGITYLETVHILRPQKF